MTLSPNILNAQTDGDLPSLQQFIDSLHDGVIITDNKGLIVAINKAAQDIYGAERLPCAGIFLSDCCAESWVQCNAVLTSGIAITGQLLRFPSVTVLVDRIPIVSSGKVTGISCLMRRTDELEKYAPLLDAYQNLEKRISRLIDNASFGTMLVNEKGMVSYVNSLFLRYAGLKKNDVLGKSIHAVNDRLGFIDGIKRVIETKMAYTAVRLLKNGVELLFSAQPCFEYGGNLIAVSAQLIDYQLVKSLSRQEARNSFSEPANAGVLEEDEVLRRVAQESNIVARSKAMLQVLQRALKVSRVESSVLIQGESGVGKSSLAAFIHKNSPRRDKPFIAINCGAIPEALLESELFGYERGAFTGASSHGKIGLLESAHQGTVFFDEIGELPLSMQVKLLEAIDKKSFLRVGGTKRVSVDIRIIAATNRVLEQEVESGTFRRDLFFRLNVIPIVIPPLRDRKEDIEIMMQNLLAMHNTNYNTHKKLSQGVFDILINYNFPGNMRELINIMEWMVVMSENDLLTIDDLPASLYGSVKHNKYTGVTKLKQAAEIAERECIKQVLCQSSTNIEAAKKLGIHISTLWRKMNQYNINSNLE